MKVWPFYRTAPRADVRAIGAEDFFGRPIDPSLSPVTPEQASGMAPVFSAVRLIAETLGSLPIHVTQSKPDGTRGKIEHALDRIFEAPNPAMTWPEFFETVVSHQELRGNGFAEIVRDRSGRPMALWPMRPNVVKAKREGGAVAYDVHTQSGVVTVDSSRILHLKFPTLSPDGITGTNPIELLRADLNAARHARDAAANYLRNGLTPSGILEHPAELSETAAKRLRDQWESTYGGSKNAGRAIVLEQGMKWTTAGHDAEKSQLLQTRQFSVLDICRIWRIPPHLLMDLSRSTFSNAESEVRSLITLSLRPRMVRLERALDRVLLTDAERAAGLRIKLNPDAVLRGATKERYEAHAIGLQNGWLSRAEVRRLEDLPEVPGLDNYLEGAPGAVAVGGETQPAGDGQNEDTEE